MRDMRKEVQVDAWAEETLPGMQPAHLTNRDKEIQGHGMLMVLIRCIKCGIITKLGKNCEHCGAELGYDGDGKNGKRNTKQDL